MANNQTNTYWLPSIGTYDNSNFGIINEISSCGNTSSVNCPNDIYPNKEGPQIIQDIIQLKDSVFKILHGESEYPDEGDNDDYKNEEIDTIIENIEKFSEDFQTLQKEFHEVDRELTQEIKNIKSNIDKLDTMIEFINKLNIDPENKLMEDIVVNIKKLSNTVSKTENFEKLKKKYVEKRKQLNKYLYLFRKINKWNFSNMCPICLSNSIDHYLDPCGHTLCKECIEQNAKMNNQNQNQENIDSFTNNTQCPICRVFIQKSKPLFIL